MGRQRVRMPETKKPTYVSLYGLEGTKKHEELYKLALKELDDFGDKADVLRGSPVLSYTGTTSSALSKATRYAIILSGRRWCSILVGTSFLKTG